MRKKIQDMLEQLCGINYQTPTENPLLKSKHGVLKSKNKNFVK